MTSDFQACFLVGPTACGKTAVAHLLARRHGFEILSADAMLVYRGLDLGTAKPTVAEREGIVYHGIDLVDPDQSFNVGAYLEHARGAFAACAKRKARMLVTGGTGLYLKALRKGLDPAGSADPERRTYWTDRLHEEGLAALQAEIEIRAPGLLARMPDGCNPRRVVRVLERLEQGLDPLPWTGLTTPDPPMPALTFEPSHLALRIERRVNRMLADGLLDEVRGLLQRFPDWSPTARGAIGYAEARAALAGEISEEAAREQIATRTRQLAKRQRTWFRHQTPVTWIEGPVDEADLERAAAAVEQHWKRHEALPVAGVSSRRFSTS